jgi:hypothetical protein
MIVMPLNEAISLCLSIEWWAKGGVICKKCLYMLEVLTFVDEYIIVKYKVFYLCIFHIDPLRDVCTHDNNEIGWIKKAKPFHYRVMISKGDMRNVLEEMTRARHNGTMDDDKKLWKIIILYASQYVQNNNLLENWNICLCHFVNKDIL